MKNRINYLNCRSIIGVFIILALNTLGCFPATEIASTKIDINTNISSGEIQFNPFSLEQNNLTWALANPDQEIQLSISGIFSLDGEIAFLFGSFTSEGVSDIRSVVLRTTDSGEHWTEVMIPQRESLVGHLVFLGSDEGWATISFTTEGIQGSTLWHTNDAGNNWEQFPNVNTGRTGILGIRFMDASTGQLFLVDQVGNPNKDGIAVWVTHDGGSTWIEGYRYLSVNPWDIKKAYIDNPGGRYGSHWGSCRTLPGDECLAYGKDGSEWQILKHSDLFSYSLSILSPGNKEPNIHINIPINYSYKDGIMMPKE